VKHLLADDREIEVVGIATNSEQLRKMCVPNPDVVLADHAMSRRLLDKGENDFKILLASGAHLLVAHRELQYLVSRGLAGILAEGADADTLKQAMRVVCAGDLWMDHETLKESLRVENHVIREIPLTRREAEILHHLRSGWTNKEIAGKLFVSEQAVKIHFNHLYKKFGVTNRVKLALSAHELLSGPFMES
jgi:DNA-binding NarL/FixJ family response regulator